MASTSSSLFSSLITALAPTALTSLFGSTSTINTTIEEILAEIMQDKNNPAIVTSLAMQIIGTTGCPAAVAAETHMLISDAGNPQMVMADIAAIQAALAANNSGVLSSLSKLVKGSASTAATTAS